MMARMLGGFQKLTLFSNFRSDDVRACERRQDNVAFGLVGEDLRNSAADAFERNASLCWHPEDHADRKAATSASCPTNSRENT